MKYAGYTTGIKVNAVVERMDEGYIAYVPHLPGCFSAGKSVEEALGNLRRIMDNHFLDFEINDSISSLSDFTLGIAG